ncbi:MAG: hypothetical protein AAFX79_09675 [Planctomycetota bacterium]
MSDVGGGNPGGLGEAELARLIRGSADGELLADEQARLDALVAERPEVLDLVEDERRLRSAVARVMDGPPCPQATRDRVAALLASTPLDGAKPVSDSHSDVRSATPADDHYPGEAHDDPPQPIVLRQRVPFVGRALALAAAVLLVVTAVIAFQQFGTGSAGGPPSGLQLASFMTDEHSRCRMAPDMIEKFTERDLAQVPAAFRDWLGADLSTTHLLGGDARLIGAGRCGVPGDGPSVHLLYEAFNAQGEKVEVSLYVQHCDDERFAEGKAFRVGDESETVVGWRRGDFVHYLVTTNAEDTKHMAERMSAPEVNGAL